MTSGHPLTENQQATIMSRIDKESAQVIADDLGISRKAVTDTVKRKRRDGNAEQL